MRRLGFVLLAVAAVAALSSSAEARGRRGYYSGYGGNYYQSGYATTTAPPDCGCQCGATTAPAASGTANVAPATGNPTPAVTGGAYSGSSTSGYRGTDLPPTPGETRVDVQAPNQAPREFRDNRDLRDNRELNRNSQSIQTRPQDSRIAPPAPDNRDNNPDPLAPTKTNPRIDRNNNGNNKSPASSTLPGTSANANDKRTTESGDGPGPSPVPQPPVGADAIRPSDSKK